MAGDWKKDLGKLGSSPGGSGQTKKCKVCEKPLKPDSRFDTCFECSKKGRETGTDSGALPADYLSKLAQGYFDQNGCLWEEFVTTLADKIAFSFGKSLNNHQLRRFYGHAKTAENRLKMTKDWPAVNVDIKKLSSFAAEAKGKNKIPESFFAFLDKNVKAIKDEKDFDAFLEHFQAVVAYFTYHYPRN